MKIALRTLFARHDRIHVVPDQDEAYLPVMTLDTRQHLQVTW